MSNSNRQSCGCNAVQTRADNYPPMDMSPADARSAEFVQISQFNIPGMDCPSEERLIQLALANVEPALRIECNFSERTLTVWHTSA